MFFLRKRGNMTRANLVSLINNLYSQTEDPIVMIRIADLADRLIGMGKW